MLASGGAGAFQEKAATQVGPRRREKSGEKGSSEKKRREKRSVAQGWRRRRWCWRLVGDGACGV